MKKGGPRRGGSRTDSGWWLEGWRLGAAIFPDLLICFSSVDVWDSNFDLQKEMKKENKMDGMKHEAGLEMVEKISIKTLCGALKLVM